MTDTTAEEETISDEEYMEREHEWLRRERKTRQAEAAMFFALGLFVAYVIISFSSHTTAWVLTGGFAVVAFIAALGFLRSRS